MRLVIDMAQVQGHLSTPAGVDALQWAQALVRNARSHDVWVVCTHAHWQSLEKIDAAFADLSAGSHCCCRHVPIWPAPYTPWLAHAAEVLRIQFLAGLQPDLVYTPLADVGASGKSPVAVPDSITRLNSVVSLTEMPDAEVLARIADVGFERASLICCACDPIARRVRSVLGEDRSVVTVGHGVGGAYVPMVLDESRSAELLAGRQMRRMYVLTTADSKSAAATGPVIDAYARLSPAWRERLQLVILDGQDSACHERIQRQASAAGLMREEYVLLPELDDAQRAVVMNLAHLFVYPDIGDRFARVLLQAIQCGVPALGPDTPWVSALITVPEGRYGPGSAESLSVQINQLLSHQAQAMVLSTLGRAVAETLSWDAVARRCWQAFELQSASADTAMPWSDRQLVASLLSKQLPQDASSEGQRVAVCIGADRNRRLLEALSISCRSVDRGIGLTLGHSLPAGMAEALAGAWSVAHPDGGGDWSIQVVGPDQMSAMIKHPPSGPVVCHLGPDDDAVMDRATIDQWSEVCWAVTCSSGRQMRQLTDLGLRCPMAVAGHGMVWVDQDEDQHSMALAEADYRVLVDAPGIPLDRLALILTAWRDLFADKTGVQLICHVHPAARQWLEVQSAESAWSDRVIGLDLLPADRLQWLYRQSDLLVAVDPSPGYPTSVMRAWHAGLAVVCDAFGGRWECCHRQTAWLVDYRLQLRDDAAALGAVASRIDPADLVSAMSLAYHADPTDRRARADRGLHRLKVTDHWHAVAARWTEIVRYWLSDYRPVEPKVGWITPWHSRSGQAVFSEQMLVRMPMDVTIFAADQSHYVQCDGPEVIRCWHPTDYEPLHELTRQVESRPLDVLVIQWVYGQYGAARLSQFIHRQVDAGRVVIVQMHETIGRSHKPYRQLDLLVGALKRCHRILVHTVSDMNYLKTLGITEPVMCLPLAVAPAHHDPGCGADHKPGSSTWVLGADGLARWHKGFVELVQAVGLLNKRGLDVRLQLAAVACYTPGSEQMLMQLRSLIDAEGLGGQVTLTTGYRSDSERAATMADVDLMVCSHQYACDSTSSAARYAMSLGLPVAVTPVGCFEDLHDGVYRLPGTSAEAMAKGLAECFEQWRQLHAPLKARAEAWCQRHRIEASGMQMADMIRALALQQALHCRGDQTI